MAKGNNQTPANGSALIGFEESAAKSKEVLGRVYEYIPGKFASAEGKGGREFHTPPC